jgi:hypothetical protein
MKNPNCFTESDREAVLAARAKEQALKVAGKPYSEGVIIACEVCLRVNKATTAQEWSDTMYIKTVNVPEYWWNKED